MSLGKRLFLLAGAVVCSSSLGLAAAENSPPSPQELVREALFREIYGERQERDRLLDEALQAQPDFAPAMWARGMIQENGRWVKSDEAAATVNQIELYRQRRDAAGDTAAEQLALADWCRQQGLADQERVHLLRVVELEPGHTDAMLRLGFRPAAGGWLSAEQERRRLQRLTARNTALAEWRDPVDSIRGMLRHDSGRRRNLARRRLDEIGDASAVFAVEAILSSDSEGLARLAIEFFARFDDHEATMALARQAVVSPWDSVRHDAAVALRGRSREGFIPEMLAAMYTPITSRTIGWRGREGWMIRETFSREGQDQVERVVLTGGAGAPTDREVARRNALTQLLNVRLADALNTITDQSLPASPRAWWEWWNDENEIYVEGEKQVVEIRPDQQLARLERFRDLAMEQRIDAGAEWSNSRRRDCLAAGTAVWTSRGPVAIEQIEAGDLVLSQHPETGELDYKVVLETTVRPAEELIVIRVGTETISASGGHPFWVAGEGWVKARDLRAGMELHACGGTARVLDVLAGHEEESYNLIVDDFRTYFVGEARVLSHDNTARRPVASVVPGLSP